MLNLINWENPLMVNGVEYVNSAAAMKALGDFSGDVEIFISGGKVTYSNEQKAEEPAKKEEIKNEIEYKVSVRQYMTKPSSPGFDFMKKWNDDVPMPLRTMVGIKLEETKGMIKMRLHGQPFPTSTCIACGRTLTHKVSAIVGIGPECGKHFNINPFETEEELNAIYDELRKNMKATTWEGWIIKSAITDIEELTEH